MGGVLWNFQIIYNSWGYVPRAIMLLVLCNFDHKTWAFLKFSQFVMHSLTSSINEKLLIDLVCNKILEGKTSCYHHLCWSYIYIYNSLCRSSISNLVGIARPLLAAMDSLPSKVTWYKLILNRRRCSPKNLLNIVSRIRCQFLDRSAIL